VNVIIEPGCRQTMGLGDLMGRLPDRLGFLRESGINVT
jgi:hypothetical protein